MSEGTPNKVRLSGANDFTIRRQDLSTRELSRFAVDFEMWVESVLGDTIVQDTSSANYLDAFLKQLASGVILCKLFMKMYPDVSIPFEDTQSRSLPEGFSTAVHRENLQLFVNACIQKKVLDTKGLVEDFASGNAEGVVAFLRPLKEVYEKRSLEILEQKNIDSAPESLPKPEDVIPIKTEAKGDSLSDASQEEKSFKWLWITGALAAGMVAFELLRKGPK